MARKLVRSLALLCLSASFTICMEAVADDAPLIEASHTFLASPHEQDAQQVLDLIARSTELREQLPGFIEEANEAMAARKGALPAAYTLRLGQALAQAEELRNGLFDQALRHRGALYRVDTGLKDEDRLAEIVIAMSAAVTLFENYNAMREALAGSPVLRHKLNEKYPEFGVASHYYDSSVLRASNPEYRKAMSDAIRYFSENRTAIEQHLGYAPESIRALYAHVAHSPIPQAFKGSNVFKEIAVLPVKAIGGLVDLSGHELGRLQFTTSKIVGNTLGLVRWRSGKLKNDQQMLQAVMSHLQPGDILLEKSPFTLTDKTIPGHFGHVAIYIGSIEQLRDMGALDLPLVQKNLESIAAGHSVVEALRNGVQLDRLQDFMNVDDVAILRPRHLTAEERLHAVNLALGNLGKEYDFNFNVNTTETIVCSELAYLTYPSIDFVTKRVLNSFTISPDDVAQRAGNSESDPLEVVLFVHDGKIAYAAEADQRGLALYDKLVKRSPPARTPQKMYDDAPDDLIAHQ